MAGFGAQLAKFAKQAGKNADLVVTKVCLDAATRVIEKTPVDTGRLRANWQATIGQPAGGQVEAEDKQGAMTIQKVLGPAGQAPGRLFYLTNNLSYAVVAEFGMWGSGDGATQKTTRDGHSIQAPSGMVRVTMAEIQRSLE